MEKMRMLCDTLNCYLALNVINAGNWFLPNASMKAPLVAYSLTSASIDMFWTPRWAVHV